MEHAEAFLLALPRFADAGAAAYRPGFDRMHALLDAMGRPHEAFGSVHVAGTNGKGSTASMVAAIATAAGQRTGLHTSPHLARLTERLRIDGVPAPDAWLDDAVARFRAVLTRVQPSFFEATVALSFLYFAEQAVDLAVVEVGLGGRLDATNVLTPRLALITAIGLDHADLLGDTLAAIAREKAGIIKPGVPVLTANTDPAVVDAIRAVAAAQAAPLHRIAEETTAHITANTPGGLTLDLETPHRRYPGLRVDLPGRHQAENAALAVCAAELCLAAVRAEAHAVYAGLGAVRRLAGLRGRFDVLGTAPLVVADVGHNAEALAVTLATLRSVWASPGGRLHVVFGVMRDKALAPMAALLADAGAVVYPARLDAPRALDAETLAAVLRAHGVAVARPVTPQAGVAHFYETAQPHDALLITGSYLTVGPLYTPRQAPTESRGTI